jgi:AraC-like DNA-binding protein
MQDKAAGDLPEKLENLCSHVRRLPLQEGLNETAVPYLKIYKQAAGEKDLPVCEHPLYVISGSLSLHGEEESRVLSEGDFFVPRIYHALSATAGGNREFLALVLTFSVDEIVSLLLEIDESELRRIYSFEAPAEASKAYSEKFADIFIRMPGWIGDAFMLNNLKRELIYEIVHSPFGRAFLENTFHKDVPAEIFDANRWIKQNYRKDFSVEDLALKAHMSVSNFHQKFKAFAGMGPIQCQKKLRLVEARRLMLDESANVTSAALAVGYESLSQFISDYRRMFGHPPQKDIQAIRKCLITGKGVKGPAR